ncbi:putative F-box/FBD/LRR-repeat protein At5g44950 [Arabidopsis lyrata subsp. lyrata]|uniref:putative F-box/FBD/LRR-repeat protein At5g44950 n=1 Tax=Arabidopsis lyrata subsp. lyrata TaxID=81972 RepID=UPI000A29D8E8|nr:putative F-box/FBD/LRR-repeat protein At5g44950 [Arabidopsis lyrata subsp. lyrata]|eukprot:XP_020866105.1 putative F-box/FBD/LRR-repeat protein At5g44950 [Arabidopsis lyrata subsp. lyrata]
MHIYIELDTEFNVKFDSSPIEPVDLSKRDIIRDFLTGISIVRHMIISHRILEVLYHYSKLGPIPTFHNLSHLQASFSSPSLQLLPAFLESCPNLKNLILDSVPEQIDLTSVPRCLTSTLEYVKINKLIMREETGIKLVNYFLENLAVLKKLALSFVDCPMPNKASDIIMELVTSTKLSHGCQVIVDLYAADEAGDLVGTW